MTPGSNRLIHGSGIRALCKHSMVQLAGREDPWLKPDLSLFPRREEVDHASIGETEGILFALARAVEQRDRQTGKHCERLAFISVMVGVGLGLDQASLLALYRGGYLHDVGKVGIPDSILVKPGKLTAEEWALMQSHTTRGEEICRHMKSLGSILPIIRHHHERWDGSGYPDGLQGEQIPLLARVLQVADVYDALTSQRSYKPAYPTAMALRILKEETDRGWRDPRTVGLFLNLHEEIEEGLARYNAATERDLESMRTSLASLREILAGATPVGTNWPAIKVG
jgi:response regulator RpfG family c-di-GMP phosphodiesterase